MTKTISLPKGFKKHDGGKCPVDPDSYVETLIHTSEGIGSGQVTKASAHEWEHDKHDGGLGAVVAYRLAERGEASHFDRLARFKVRNLAAPTGS